jgi:hypothetical protein
MGDQPVARPLPIQTQTPIYALNGFEPTIPFVRAGEDSSCFRACNLVTGEELHMQ